MESSVQLWNAQKDGTFVHARVRILPVGFELRMEFSSGAMFSQMFTSLEDVHAAADQRRAELEGRGWSVS